VGCGDLVEDGDLHSSNVVHAEPDLQGAKQEGELITCAFLEAAKRSLLEGSHLSRCNRSNILQDLVLDIITGGIVNPSKREIRFFQRSTHHLFVIHDLKGDRHSSYEQLR
jgi:hypothetical protein